jgi:hypothetical protein
VHALNLRSPGALINLEMQSLARQRRASLIEVGVTHYPRQAGTSTGAKPSVVLQAMREIIVLRLRIWRTGLGLGGAIRLLAGASAGLTILGTVFRKFRRR